MDWSLHGILDRFDAIILGGIESVFSSMSSALADVFIGAMIIVVAILTIKTFTVFGSMRISDYFTRVFFIFLVTGILLKWELVNLFVVDVFYHTPTALLATSVEALTGKAMESPNEIFEHMATAALKMGFMIKKEGDGMVDMIVNAAYAAAFTYVLAKLILKGLIPIISAKVTIMLMSCITVIIAIAYLFDRGKNMATGWLQVLFTNMLIILFTYLLVSVFSTIVLAFYADFRAIDDYVEIITVAFAFGLFIVAIRHVLMNAEIAARNLGNAYGNGNADVGQRAAWKKFVTGTRQAISGNARAANVSRG